MPAPDFTSYALRHPDGRWLYHLPASTDYDVTGVLAEHPGTPPGGRAMTRISERSPWWATDAEATRIILVKRQRALITGYAINDADAASVRYPAELTAEDWDTRRNQATEAERERLWSLYTSVTVPQDAIEQYIDGPFPVLEGAEPPAAGGPAWTVNLLDSITQRPEYQHLFPGYLTGLRKHVVALIKRMPRVQHCFDGFQDSTAVYVDLNLRYEKPETLWVPNTGRNGKRLKSGQRVERTVSRTLHLPVSDIVAGPNHAAALAEWDRQVSFWTQTVTDATVTACNHCQGTGHVPSGSEQYTHTK